VPGLHIGLPARGKGTPRVKGIPRLGPIAAKIGLGGPPVGPAPSVEGTMHPILHQKSARRDHFPAQGERGEPLELAEVGDLAGPQQGFQPALPGGAHDLDLEVPAAGGASAVVGGAAGGGRAGVAAGVKGKLAGCVLGRWELPSDRPARFDDAEPVSSQAARLRRVGALRGFGPGVAVRRAARAPVLVPPQEAAGHLEHRFGIEVPPVSLQVSEEADPLGMPQQPGRFMVGGAGPGVLGGHSEQDLERVAVGPHPPAGRCTIGSGGRHWNSR